PVSDRAENEAPAFLMTTAEFVVRDIGMVKFHERFIAPGLQGQRDHGLKTASGFGYPRVLNAQRPIDCNKAPLVRPIVALELNQVIEESIDDGLNNGPRGPEPGAPRALRVDPHIEHIGRSRWNRASYRQVHRLHCGRIHFRFPLSAKNASRRSRRWFQKRSYIWTQRATSRSGLPSNVRMSSRPCRTRRTSPARSSILRCFETSFSDTENG